MLKQKGSFHLAVHLTGTFFMLLGSFVFQTIPTAQASHEIPVFFRDGNGDPITTALELRVSLWDAYDFRSDDVNPDGSINSNSLHYGQYQHEFTITPNEDGYFVPVTYGFYRLKTADLPNFPTTTPFNAYIQLEYKAAAAPETDYEVFDFLDDPPLQNVTRMLLDENSTYYVFDAGPRTYWNTFTLDVNNNAPTEIVLQFGETLAKKLSFNKSTDIFELNDSLSISGGLTATGTINFQAASVGIGTSNPQSALHVADGYYAQFADNNVGAPPAEDCDNNSEIGRLSLDTQNNRLYLCLGATRGWDYTSLND